MAEIKALYLDAVTWHTNHFQLIVDWFEPFVDTTTTGTDAPTNPPTNPPTDPPTNPPTNPPTTDPPTDAPSSAPTTVAFLSFGIAVLCLALNL